MTLLLRKCTRWAGVIFMQPNPKSGLSPNCFFTTEPRTSKLTSTLYTVQTWSICVIQCLQCSCMSCSTIFHSVIKARETRFWTEHPGSWQPQRAFWQGHWQWFIYDLCVSKMKMNECCMLYSQDKMKWHKTKSLAHLTLTIWLYNISNLVKQTQN